MTVLHQLASALGRRDEAPNQELARRLVEQRDMPGIQEIAANLWNQDAAIQSDCLKVLYEIGTLDAALAAPYTGDFLKLLHSRGNRLVWGAMIALATVAGLRSEEIFAQRGVLLRLLEKGSVITQDNAVKALAIVASKSAAHSQEILPYLLAHLASCRPKDVPQHAESSLVAMNGQNAAAFIAVLERRLADGSPAQQARVRKVIRQASKLAE
jgi:hypothetical protein